MKLFEHGWFDSISSQIILGEIMILKCTCQNAGQDKIHGKGSRVHNPTVNSTSQKTWRCTVCGSEK